MICDFSITDLDPIRYQILIFRGECSLMGRHGKGDRRGSSTAGSNSNRRTRPFLEHHSGSRSICVDRNACARFVLSGSHSTCIDHTIYNRKSVSRDCKLRLSVLSFDDIVSILRHKTLCRSSIRESYRTAGGKYARCLHRNSDGRCV